MLTIITSQILVFCNEYFLIPANFSLIVLAFGDGSSGLFGSIIKSNFILTKHKSLIGLISFILFSFVGMFIYNTNVGVLSIINILLISVTCSIIELLTEKGLDNFTVYYICMALVIALI